MQGHDAKSVVAAPLAPRLAKLRHKLFLGRAPVKDLVLTFFTILEEFIVLIHHWVGVRSQKMGLATIIRDGLNFRVVWDGASVSCIGSGAQIRYLQQLFGGSPSDTATTSAGVGKAFIGQ